jgi:hypothetical protein
MNVKTTRRSYRIDRRQIGFVKFILEAYDNVAVLTTVNARQAVVQVTIAPGCEAMVDDIMTDLAGEIEMVFFGDSGLSGVVDENADGRTVETVGRPLDRRD